VRVPVGSSVSVLTDPFDAVPASATAVAVDAAGVELDPAPVCEVEGAAVAVALTAATHTAELDRLAVTVTAEVDGLPQVQVLDVQVVGSHYVTVAGLRTEPDLERTDRYSDELIAQFRDEWCDHLEELIGYRMVPGLDVVRLTGRGGNVREYLPVHYLRRVRRVLADGELLAAGTDYRVDLRAGLLSDHYTDRGVELEVHVEAGLDRPPAKLVRELRKVVRRDLLARGARGPSDAISETSPEGGPTIRYSTPDPRAGRWTGVLSLDPVITSLRLPRLGIA
jgi:hypothetical protein